MLYMTQAQKLDAFNANNDAETRAFVKVWNQLNPGNSIRLLEQNRSFQIEVDRLPDVFKLRLSAMEGHGVRYTGDGRVFANTCRPEIVALREAQRTRCVASSLPVD